MLIIHIGILAARIGAAASAVKKPSASLPNDLAMHHFSKLFHTYLFLTANHLITYQLDHNDRHHGGIIHAEYQQDIY